jgi:3-hydroxyisobutyrate dehydrogenase-like beta-hydroxyacid dehydrogenase
MTETVGFIGLGLMGGPMAMNLVTSGHRLRIYNRSPDKAAPLLERGALLCHTPAGVAEGSDIVVTMVADDAVLELVTFGEHGFAPALRKGGIHLSMSTVSAETARRLAAQHAGLGADYVAAPVFGRPNAAQAAKLWICQSGSAAAKQRVGPLLDAMGQGVHDFGEEVGAANVAKLAGNFMIAAALESMAEAYTLAEKHGLDRRALSDFLTPTIFASPVYANYGSIVAAKQADWIGFVLRLALKDLNLVLDAAEAGRVPMPFANIVHDRLISAIAKGRGEEDWTAFTLGAVEDAGLPVAKSD